jgi:hypothetical protein
MISTLATPPTLFVLVILKIGSPNDHGLVTWQPWDLDKDSFCREVGVKILQGEFKQCYCKGGKDKKQ